MLNHRLRFKSARRTNRGGFTLVELLVVIGIIAILAGVALGPITNGIKKAKQSTAMQNARSIDLLCFQYSVDNDGTYPAGPTAGTGSGTATGVAIQLLQGKYVTDPNIFYMSGAPGKSKLTNASADFSTLTAANVCWDFTAVTGTSGPATGVTSSANDLLPVVFFSGNGQIQYPTSIGTGLNLQLVAASGSNGNVMGLDGIAVAYKSNSAKFIPGILNGSGAVANGFIDTSYNDQTSYTNLEP